MESDKTINNIRNFLKGLWCLVKHTEPPQDIKFIYNGPKNLLYQHLKNYLNINPFNLIIVIKCLESNTISENVLELDDLTLLKLSALGYLDKIQTVKPLILN